MTSRRLVNRPNDIAVFYSDDEFDQIEMNSGSGMSLLPLVQDLRFGFDGLPKKNSFIGSRKNSFTYPNQAPDVSVDISILENFETLFEHAFTGNGIVSNLDNGKNFYFLISDEEKREGLSSYKNSISIGNCFLDSINIKQNINGILKSDYSYVGSNIIAQEYRGRPNVTSTYNRNLFSEAASNTQNFTSVATLTTPSEGLASQGSQKLIIDISSMPLESNYRVVKTTANGSFSFGNSQDLFTGINTIVVPAVSFDRSVKIQFSNDNIQLTGLTINNQKLWPTSGYEFSSGTAPSVNLTGDQQPVGNFVFGSIEQEISDADISGEFIVGRQTFVEVSGIGSNASFLIKPDNLQSFDCRLNFNRKRINSVDKYFPMGRKATPPFLGTISLENKFSDIEVGDSFINFLKNPDEYNISIISKKANKNAYKINISKAFLDSKKVDGSISSELSENATFVFGLDDFNVDSNFADQSVVSFVYKDSNHIYTKESGLENGRPRYSGSFGDVTFSISWNGSAWARQIQSPSGGPAPTPIHNNTAAYPWRKGDGSLANNFSNFVYS